ncbi:hypothetical protein [Frankia sp. Cj3]|uniref:hypothetical protein n=2 Tax=unclassified Frankia TaxID=2632575 RepID=UPI001EF4670E|nr:hypothetical protein [Frankia sp. Cj3]
MRLDASSPATARQRQLRQSWQPDAWKYLDLLPPIHYANTFLGRACSRMRLFAAAYTDDPKAPPIPVEDATDLPAGLADAAAAAMARLGSGRMATAALMNSYTVNLSVPGECYLLGRDETYVGESWEIRSIDEIVTTDKGYYLRDLPADPSDHSIKGELLPPDAYIARLWQPHPRWRALADSPARAILEPCEELLWLSRGIRAAAKSRAMTNGILLVPDELTIMQADESDDSENGDPFMDALTRALVAPLTDEGSPSSVVPLALRGPGAILAMIQHLRLDREIDKTSIGRCAELIREIAIGIDLPSEVLLGVADVNHWTAWQIDDSTFKYHVEPVVQREVDGLTAGYFWPTLAAEGFTPAEYRRVVIWYDPTELVTHPDRTEDALKLWDRHAISNEALRGVAGFGDDDEPSGDEIVERIALRLGRLPDNVVEAIVHRIDPSLEIPANTRDPGIGPDGPTPPIPPASPAPTSPDTPGEEKPTQDGPPPADRPEPHAPTSIQPRILLAAGSPRSSMERISIQLAEDDRALRDRLQVAADADMRRALERAGARVRSRTRHNSRVASALDGIPNMTVCATLGRTVTCAAVADVEEEDDSRWDGLREHWRVWVAAVLSRIRGRLARLVAHATADDHSRLEVQQVAHAAMGWEWLAAAMTRHYRQMLYQQQTTPEPVASHERHAPVISAGSSLVPMRLIRAAVAIAGGMGAQETSAGLTGEGAAVNPRELLGGAGTGPDVRGWLAGFDVLPDVWEWQHHTVTTPFLPHAELDGLRVSGPDDDALTNFGSFPPGVLFFPGDHPGCACDLVPIYQAASALAACAKS